MKFKLIITLIQQIFSFITKHINTICTIGTCLIAILTFLGTYKQTNWLHQEQFRQSIMPYINIDINNADICYENNNYYILSDMKPLRVMILTPNLTEYCNNLVFPFAESNDKELIHNEAIYPYIQYPYIANKTVGVVIKEVSIQNIGLNTAVVINVFIDDVCQWKFNLRKDDLYTFYLVIDPQMFGKKNVFKIIYQDIIGNEYEQECYFIIYPSDDYSGETYEKSMISTPICKQKGNR